MYVCAFKMEDAFPPASLLNGHMACIQKRVQAMVKKGSDEAQVSLSKSCFFDCFLIQVKFKFSYITK